MSDEIKINISGQWFYRGNKSPAWFALASGVDGSASGIADKIEPYVWPILEEVARLRSELEEYIDFMSERGREIWIEHGYRACERGENIQSALAQRREGEKE